MHKLNIVQTKHEKKSSRSVMFVGSGQGTSWQIYVYNVCRYMFEVSLA